MRPVRPEIVRVARSLLGTPFRHHGRDPETGLDCLGLILHVGRVLGATLPNSIPRYRTAGPVEFAVPLFLEWTEPSEEWEGSILLVETHRLPRHFAIASRLGDRPGLVHACVRRGRVVEHGHEDEKILHVRIFRWS